MLVLQRKIGEAIRISDDIEIVVLSQRKGYIKLGIDAPPDVKVHRKEVYEAIQRKDEE